MTPSFISRCYGSERETVDGVKIGVMRKATLLFCASLAIGACVAPASTSPAPTVSPSPTIAPSPTVPPSPTSARGTALVPPIVSHAQYGDVGITLDIPDRPGQPAAVVAWHVHPFKPDAGY